MDINQKHRFESIACLWQGAKSNFNTRRTYEWKFCFVIWATFASFIGSYISGNYKIISPFLAFYIIIVGGFVTVLHVWWIIGLGDANKLDQEIATHYEKELQKISATSFDSVLQSKIDKRSQKTGDIFNWSHSTQVGITLILYISSIIIILG